MSEKEKEGDKVVTDYPALGEKSAQEEDPMAEFLDNIVKTVQRMNDENYNFKEAELGEDGMKLTFSSKSKKKSFNLRLGGKKDE